MENSGTQLREDEPRFHDGTREQVRLDRGDQETRRDDRATDAFVRGLCEGLRDPDLERIGREAGREARRDPRRARELAERLDKAAELLRALPG